MQRLFWPIGLACAISFSSADVWAGAGCIDACTSINGPACILFGQGCNPNTGLCSACVDDRWCQPLGMCVGGSCINVLCGVDAGVAVDASGTDASEADASDGGGQDANDSGELDAALDASMDASSPDVVPDSGRFDALPPTGGGSRPVRDTSEKEDEGCSCNHHASGNLGWLALAPLFWWVRKK